MTTPTARTASADRRRSSQSGARRSSAGDDVPPAQVEAMRQAVMRARQDSDAEELLQVLCENNGWTMEAITQAPHLVRSLEAFLLTIPHVPVLKLFPHLTTIKLQHVALESMADLKPLTNVEELWITDNNVTCIEGLDNMTNLRKLFLTGNSITSMEGLPCLKHLKELWLCRNRITVITGLDRVRKLRSLWIAENPLASLNGAFTGELTKLHEVNLAGCQVASFAEIQRLAVLPCLRAVWLTDPLFGVSPVCQLNNYTTFALHALPSLDRLDGAVISHDQRAMAASIYRKKALYYETRMAALTRNYSLLQNKVDAAARRVLNRSLDATRDLKEVLLPIQYDLAERQMYGGCSLTFHPASDYPLTTLEAAQCELRRAVGTREMEQSTVAKRLVEATSQARQALHHHLRRLTAELETGGNARLEEIKPEDGESWYESARELVVARFDPVHFKKNFDIDGITVQRIFRVHSRSRRLYFDEHVKELQVDLSEPYNRKRLVCLLAAVPGSAEGQRALVEYIVEHGFDAVDENSLGEVQASVLAPQVRPSSEGVPLTNSLFLADEARLRAAQADGSLAGINRDASALRGAVVVSRVFMGKNVAALGGRGGSTAGTVASAEAQAFMTGNGSRVLKKDYSAGTFAAYRVHPEDSECKVWHCFDRALVLPEFIVEYSYTTSHSEASAPSASDTWREMIERALPEIPPRDYDDLRETAASLLEVWQWCGGVGERDTEDGDTACPNTLTQVAQSETKSALEAADALSAVVQTREAASSAPPGPLTAATVEAYFAQLNDPTEPSFCQLRGHRLTAVPADFHAPLFATLTALDMSRNHLIAVSWHALALAAPELQHLNLSDNQLQCLQLCGSQLPSLLTLDLSFNQLDSLDEFQQLCKSFPNLQSLHVEQNPCLQAKNAECVVLSYLFESCPRLEVLNGIQLTALTRKPSIPMERHDRSLLLGETSTPGYGSVSVSQGALTDDVAMMDTRTVSLQWLVDRVYGTYSPATVESPPSDRFEDALATLGSMALSARKKAPFLRNDLSERRKKSQSGDARAHVVLATVPRLSITETLLRTLDWVAMVPNLLVLELRGNCLEDIRPVLQLTKLEVLNVQENRLVTLPPLADLKHLRELNLSDNQLTTLSTLGGPLKSLCRLNVNNNRLDLLDVPLIVGCENLEELYAAANELDSPKELCGLREMAHLTSLDLCANPLFGRGDQTAEEVRQYLVYSLPNLKVLDGVPITPGETQRAQSTFAGKLSGDLLSERVRVPQSRWSTLKELDLSRCALREVSLLSAFISLEVLKLDHNGILKIDGIASLHHLKALNLSHNKLGTTAIGYTGGVLKQIPSLESLSLEANHIQDMAHIGLEQPELLFLNLKGNELQFVEHAFDRVPKLREVILDQNRLRTIGVNTFTNCRQLTSFSADENALRAIDGVASLPFLTTLSLGSNRVPELSQLAADLASCPLTEAVFVGNPAARKPNYRATVIAQFPRLVRLDRKDITPEERERALSAKAMAYTAPPNVFIDMSYMATPTTNTTGMPFVAPQPTSLPPVQGQLRSMTANTGSKGNGKKSSLLGRGGARGGGGGRRR